MGGATIGVIPDPTLGCEPVRAGTGGTVAEFTRPVCDFDPEPVVVRRAPVMFEREGLTEPVMGWRLWLPLMARASPPLSVGNRLCMS